MSRTFRWNWLGAIALAAYPTLALGQANTSHSVREGDTLWDLARQYRGDPFLWPDIYRLNTGVVEDPHWIYPGEVLRLAASDSITAVPTVDTPAPEAVAADSAGTATDTVAIASVESDTVSVARPDSTRSAEQPVAAAEPVEEPKPTSLSALMRNSKADDYTPLFGPPPGKTMEETLRAYTEQPYRPLRRSEFFSSGFLTENEKLPFGVVLGPVTPPQIRAKPENMNALPYAVLGVEAPRGATYQIGDTLLIARLGRDLGDHGEIVVPTGLARVIDTAGGNYLADVVAIYGPIRKGQKVLPAETFTPAGKLRAVPVTDGVRATLLGGSGRQDLKAPQMTVFLDKGRADGVAAGDLFEIRRHPERLSDGTLRVDDVMATMQVVHVREHSATARLLNVVSPDIAPGTEARQVAKLPS
jgi:LysM domain